MDKFYLVRQMERSGDFEYNHVHVASLDESVDLEEWGKQFAKDQRASSDSDWDETCQGYWYGDGLSFEPTLDVIPESDFNILKKYL